MKTRNKNWVLFLLGVIFATGSLACSSADNESLDSNFPADEELGSLEEGASVDHAQSETLTIEDGGQALEDLVIKPDSPSEEESSPPQDEGSPGQWIIEVVDKSSTDAGRENSIALDSSEHPHIAYYDMDNGALWYASFDGSQWDTKMVTDQGDAGLMPSLVFDSQDHAHIAHFDGISHDLYYSYDLGGGWKTDLVRANAIHGSLAIDKNDHPLIAFADEDKSDLKLASWDGVKWTFDGVDPSFWVGIYTSVKLDSSGYTHISYIDFSNYKVKYAFYTGSRWEIADVASFDANDYTFSTSLALDNSGNVHIAYYDNSRGDCRHALKTTTANWKTDPIDTTGDVGSHLSLALDSKGLPQVVYYNENGMLRYARWTGTLWKLEDIVDAGKFGGYCSLALDSEDRPHISYFDTDTSNLNYAHR